MIFEQIGRLCRVQLRELVDPDIQHIEPIEANKDIITLLLNNNRALLTVRNKVKILNDGKAKFEELFEAIEGAVSSVHLEYYIFENDETGLRLTDLLARKVKEGVEVRLIYDDVGSWNMKRRHARRLRAMGIRVCCFMPVVFPWLTSKLNNRNHRKIVVVDGKMGFRRDQCRRPLCARDEVRPVARHPSADRGGCGEHAAGHLYDGLVFRQR